MDYIYRRKRGWTIHTCQMRVRNKYIGSHSSLPTTLHVLLNGPQFYSFFYFLFFSLLWVGLSIKIQDSL
jgi:hypothetical protein